MLNLRVSGIQMTPEKITFLRLVPSTDGVAIQYSTEEDFCWKPLGWFINDGKFVRAGIDKKADPGFDLDAADKIIVE